MSDSLTDQNDTTSDDACCGGPLQPIDRRSAETLASQLGAVADPVRLQVLSIIANEPSGEVCACDFVGPLGKSQPTVSHHLKVLAEAGLVEGDKRGRWVWYRLSDNSLDRLAASLGEIVTNPPVASGSAPMELP